MRHLKISTRLGLGFGLMILLMLILAGIGAWRMLDSKNDNAVIIRRQSASMMALELKAAVEKNTALTLAMAQSRDAGVQARFDVDMTSTTDQAAKLADRLQAFVKDPKAAALLKEVLQLRAAFIRGRDQAFDDLKGGRVDDGRRYFNDDMPRLTKAYESKVEALADYQARVIDGTLAANGTAIRSGLAVLSGAALLALIFAPWFAWSVTRSITRPLSKAVSLAASVARRDLAVQIDPRGRDEITQLERSLHAMVIGLQEAIAQVHEGARAIASAAAQISAGNTDLASRTEEQSASLTETAASMEQITSTVRQNADHAQQANRLTATATQSAHQGGTTVATLVRTMEDVNAKSQRMIEIVNVIESIAFQTNILALNAAVEAARAGEQGRGFAVVASEVRALAQRSAASSKDIKNLIDATVQNIHVGNREAIEAGNGMQGIVADIARVTEIIREITSASQEQTVGIEQINVAITQMDDVTRQNASLVEESAAASSNLQEQADRLATLVSTFNLDQSARPGHRVSRFPAAGRALPGLRQAPRAKPMLESPAPIESIGGRKTAPAQSPRTLVRSASALRSPQTDS